MFFSPVWKLMFLETFPNQSSVPKTAAKMQRSVKGTNVVLTWGWLKVRRCLVEGTTALTFYDTATNLVISLSNGYVPSTKMKVKS